MQSPRPQLIEIPVSEGKGKTPNLTPCKTSTPTAEDIQQKLTAASAAREQELLKIAERSKRVSERIDSAKLKRESSKENTMDNLIKCQQREVEANEKYDKLLAARKEKAADHNRAVAEAVQRATAAESELGQTAAQRQEEREREAARKATEAIESKKTQASQHNTKVAEAVEKTQAARREKAERRRSEVDALSAPLARETPEIPEERKPDVMRRLESSERPTITVGDIEASLKSAEEKRERLLAEKVVSPNAEHVKRAKALAQARQIEEEARRSELARQVEERLQAAAARREAALEQRKQHTSRKVDRAPPSGFSGAILAGVVAAAFVAGLVAMGKSHLLELVQRLVQRANGAPRM